MESFSAPGSSKKAAAKDMFRFVPNPSRQTASLATWVALQRELRSTCAQMLRQQSLHLTSLLQSRRMSGVRVLAQNALSTWRAAQRRLQSSPCVSSGNREAMFMRWAYPDPSRVARYARLAPWFHWRMAAYCQWRVERGDQAYAPGFALECAALEKRSA